MPSSSTTSFPCRAGWRFTISTTSEESPRQRCDRRARGPVPARGRGARRRSGPASSRGGARSHDRRPDVLPHDDLAAGKKHLLFFQGVQMVTGQHWYVSAIVAKGARPGKRIVLVSGVHGDEMSPVHTIQTIMGQLDPAQMSGALLAVLDVSRPAMEGMARELAKFGTRPRSCRSQPRMARSSARPHCAFPPCRAAVQSAAQTECRLCDRFPYVDDGNEHDRIPPCADGPA